MLYRLGNEQWNIPALTEMLETVLPQYKLVRHFSVTQWKTMMVSGRRIEEPFSGDRDPLILLMIEDKTERKRAEMALARLAAIVETSDDAIILARSTRLHQKAEGRIYCRRIICSPNFPLQSRGDHTLFRYRSSMRVIARSLTSDLKRWRVAKRV
jgi:PAS domain-containing protein